MRDFLKMRDAREVETEAPGRPRRGLADSPADPRDRDGPEELGPARGKLPSSHQAQQHHKIVELIMEHILARRAALKLTEYTQMDHIGHLLVFVAPAKLKTGARTSCL